jgi:hypothetical protein
MCKHRQAYEFSSSEINDIYKATYWCPTCGAIQVTYGGDLKVEKWELPNPERYKVNNAIENCKTSIELGWKNECVDWYCKRGPLE